MKSEEIKHFIHQSLVNNFDLHKLIDLREEKIKNIPNQLYKYYSIIENEKRTAGIIDYYIDNFENDTIYFQCPLRFNDPFDCYLGASFSKQILEISYSFITDKMKNAIVNGDYSNLNEAETKRIKSFEEFYNTNANQLLQIFRDAVKELVKITCFSKNLYSPLMWAHYANKHYGFCLEYDFSLTVDVTNDTFSNLLKAQLMLFPVSYRKERMLINDLMNLPNLQDIHLRNSEILFSMLTKSDHWAYEDEWRILLFNDNNSLKLPPPKKIYLGHNIENAALERIQNIAKEKNNIPVYKMQLTNDQYGFFPVQIQ